MLNYQVPVGWSGDLVTDIEILILRNHDFQSIKSRERGVERIFKVQFWFPFVIVQEKHRLIKIEICWNSNENEHDFNEWA